jgi:hypothetical protein
MPLPYQGWADDQMKTASVLAREQAMAKRKARAAKSKMAVSGRAPKSAPRIQLTVNSADRGRKHGKGGSSSGGTTASMKISVNGVESRSNNNGASGKGVKGSSAAAEAAIAEANAVAASLEVAAVGDLAADKKARSKNIDEQKKDVAEEPTLNRGPRVDDLPSYLNFAVIGYSDFIELLARIALEGLGSKPQYGLLYPSPFARVGALLSVWGMADPIRLEEIRAMHCVGGGVFSV